MDGGNRIAEVLVSHGVKFLFTLCGGHISPILVASKHRGIRIVDVRDEANAVFAADAMARLTGTPGVAAVTAGPGVTNTMTAIKNAQLAQSPVVLIGGAAATMLRGRGALQDIDQMELIRAHVKWSARPNSLREVVPAMEQAFNIAGSGVPGPVFVELAVDLLYEEHVVRSWFRKRFEKPNKSLAERAQDLYLRGHLAYTYSEIRPPEFHRPAPPPPPVVDVKAVRTAARHIAEAQRPLMVLGSQTMLHPRRTAELIAAVERLGVPVYLSGMARGLLGKAHPLLMRHKRRDALRAADVVILCGVPCDFRLDYGAHVARAYVIGVNLSKRDLEKNRQPNLPVLGDPHTFLTAVAGTLPTGQSPRPAWFAALGERERVREQEIEEMAHLSGNADGTNGGAKSKVNGEANGAGDAADGALGDEAAEVRDDGHSRLNPLALCRAINAQLDAADGDKGGEDGGGGGSVLVGDGGDFVATASYTIAARGAYGWLDPGVFGTLGVGAGFAMAAKLSRPDADVWLLYGDGAAGFSLLEMDTFARHGLGVIAVVGNDAGWTQIARDQATILGDDVGCRLTFMDYHKVAEACGGVGLLLDDPNAMADTLAEAVAISRGGKPVLVNALLQRSDFRKGSLSM